jgi:hypothetical protein
VTAAADPPRPQHDEPARLRVVAIADSDSYVKWASALVAAIPDAEIALVLVSTPLTVSAAQERAALEGSGLGADRVHRVAFAELSAWLGSFGPDAVVLGARGPLVRVLTALVADLSPRPVIATGLPGISLPARRAALVYRAQCDLFILHSQREVEAFGELSDRVGIPMRFALAQLPFASGGIGAAPAGGGDLVFAAQAIVPREKAERLVVARMLIDAAEADPSRRVVLKLRAAKGERETHHERFAYPDLIDELGGAPANLVVSYEPMARALSRAQGLVTVSSTSAIEAIARGIPVIALDTFGVGDPLLNGVFTGSGLFGGTGEVIARWFRHPDEDWLRENYFHEEVFDDWIDAVAGLVHDRRRGELAPRTALPVRGGPLRAAWERKRVLGSEDRTLLGWVALVVGAPARQALILSRRLRGQQPGPPGSSAHVSSTSAVRTSTTRTP